MFLKVFSYTQRNKISEISIQIQQTDEADVKWNYGE